MVLTGSDLAKRILEYEEAYKELKVIEDEIKQSVLELKKSQTVGNVEVKYSGGRKTYDYRQAVADYPNSISLSDYETVKTTYDYKKMCADNNIKNIPFTQSKETVNIKVNK